MLQDHRGSRRHTAVPVLEAQQPYTVIERFLQGNL